METVSTFMIRNVGAVAPSDTLAHASHIMKEHAIGMLAVCDGPRMIGVITDQDIAAGAEACVKDVMTVAPVWCYEDTEVDDALRQLQGAGNSLIAVVNRQMNLVGLVSASDLVARHAASGETIMQDSARPIERRRNVNHVLTNLSPREGPYSRF